MGWGFKDTNILVNPDTGFGGMTGKLQIKIQFLLCKMMERIFKNFKTILSFLINCIYIGNRYEFCGKEFPGLKDWAEKQAGIDFNVKAEKQKDMEV